MTRQLFLILMTVLSSATIISCSKDNGGDNNGGNGNGGNTQQGPLFTAVKAVMQSNCAVSGCHAGGAPSGGHDFSNNNTIVGQKARIKVRAVDQAGTPSQMPPPPAPALSAADQQKITAWINAGGRITD